MKKQKGITLIALIITIIVMLILVGVTINVALNGGLFTKAEQATKETEEKAILEEMLAMMEITDEGKFDYETIIDNMEQKHPEYTIAYSYPNATITGKLGTYNYIVSETEIKIGESDVPQIDDNFKKYILGADGTGRSLIELDGEGNLIGGIFDGSNFLDDPQTEDIDEEETLGIEVLIVEGNEDSTKVLIYAKYNDKAYEITCDVTTFKSEKLEMIYEPTGREGQTTTDGWTILYDNGETVEAISPSAMGSLRLGYSATATDEVTKLTEAINSYNNAITTINNYCKTLEGLPENTGVRSVGGTTDTSSYLNESDIPEYTVGTDTWFSEYNDKIKKADMNYEQDYIRMLYWGVVDLEEAYWIASRNWSMGGINGIDNAYIMFHIRHGGNSQIDGYDFYTVQINDKSASIHASNSGYYTTAGVRPIITVENID